MEDQKEILQDLEAKIWTVAKTFESVSFPSLKKNTLTFHIEGKVRTIIWSINDSIWKYGKFTTTSIEKVIREVISDIAKHLPQNRIQEALGYLPQWAR